MTTQEIDRILEAMEKQFMQPELWESNTDSENRSGWFCRLSAPGYLDCTDTGGPFETELEAKTYLVEMYGDDIEIDTE